MRGSYLWVSLCLLSLARFAYSNGGDFSVDFAAAAPCSYYHETGGGAFNDGTGGKGNVETHDIREELEGKHWKCGDFVTYFLKVERNSAKSGDNNACATARFKLHFSDSTGQSGVAIDKIVFAGINSGDVQNGAGPASSWTAVDLPVGCTNDCSGKSCTKNPCTDAPQYNDGRFNKGGGDNTCKFDQPIYTPFLPDYGFKYGGSNPNSCQPGLKLKVVSERFIDSPSCAGKTGPNCPNTLFNDAILELVIDVENIKDIETFIVRVDGRLACDPNALRDPTGNVLAKLIDAYYIKNGQFLAIPGSGAQTIPLKVKGIQGAPPPECSACGRGCAYCGDRGAFNPLTCECDCFGSWEHPIILPRSRQPDCSVCPASARNCMHGSVFDASTCSCNCATLLDAPTGTPAAWTGGRCQTCNPNHNCGAGTLVSVPDSASQDGFAIGSGDGRCYCLCEAGATALLTDKGVICVPSEQLTCVVEYSTLFYSLDVPASTCSYFPGPGVGQTSFPLNGSPDSWGPILTGQAGNIVDATDGTRLFIVDSPGRNFFHRRALQRATHENDSHKYYANHNQHSSWIADHNAKLSQELNQLLNPIASNELRPEFWTWQSSNSDLVPDHTDLLHGFAFTAHAPSGCHGYTRPEPYIFFGMDRKSEGSFPNSANCVDVGNAKISHNGPMISSMWSYEGHLLSNLYRDYDGAFGSTLAKTLLGDVNLANTYQAGYVLVSAHCSAQSSRCSLSFVLRSSDDCDIFTDSVKVKITDSNGNNISSDCAHDGLTFDSSEINSNCELSANACGICSSVGSQDEFHFIQFEDLPPGQYKVEIEASMNLHPSLGTQKVRTPVTCLHLHDELESGKPASSSVSWWFNQKEIIPVSGFSYPYSPCQDNFQDPTTCNDFTGAKTVGDLLISAEITEDFSDLATSGSCNPWDMTALNQLKVRPRVQVWTCSDIDNCIDPLLDITDSIAADVMNSCIADGNSCSACQNMCSNPLICNSNCKYAYICVTTNQQPTTTAPPLSAHLEPRTFFEGGLRPHTLQKLLSGLTRSVSNTVSTCPTLYSGTIFAGQTIAAGITEVTFGDYAAPDAPTGTPAINFRVTMANKWKFSKIDFEIGPDTLDQVSDGKGEPGQYDYSNLNCNYQWSSGDSIFVEMIGDGSVCSEAIISVPLNQMLVGGTALTCEGDTAFKMHFDVQKQEDNGKTTSETAFTSCCTGADCHSQAFDSCSTGGKPWYWRPSFANCCAGISKPHFTNPCWPGLCYSQVMFTSMEGLKGCSELKDFIFSDSLKSQHCIGPNKQISRNGLMKCWETGSCVCDGEFELDSLLNSVANDACLCADCVPDPTQPPLPSITPSRSVSGSVPPSFSPSRTPKPSQTPTSSSSASPSASQTPTSSSSVTPTVTPSRTQTPTSSVTPTSTPSSTQTPTPSASITPSQTPSVTPTVTPTNTATTTSSPSSSVTASNTPTPTSSNTASPSSSSSPTPSKTASSSVTSSNSRTPDPSQSSGASHTSTPTQTPSSSVTATRSQTPTSTRTVTPTASTTQTPTSSVTSSTSPSITASSSSSLTASSSVTQTPSPTQTPTQTPTNTATQTPSQTATSSASESPTSSSTQTPTPTSSITRTPSNSSTRTPSRTASRTASVSPSVSGTRSSDPTPSRTPSVSITPGGSVCVDNVVCPTYRQNIKYGQKNNGGQILVWFGEYKGDNSKKAINFEIYADDGKHFTKVDLDIGLEGDVADERGAIGQYNYANLHCRSDITYPHKLNNVWFDFQYDSSIGACTRGTISVPYDTALDDISPLLCNNVAETFFKIHFDYSDGETAFMDCCNNDCENGGGNSDTCCNSGDHNEITNCSGKYAGGGGPWYWRMGIPNCCPDCPAPPQPDVFVPPSSAPSSTPSPSSSLLPSPSRPCIDGNTHFAVIVDVSGSIASAGAQGKVRESVREIIDILENGNAYLSFLKFNGPDGGGTGNANDAQFISDVNGDFYRTMRSSTDVTALRGEVLDRLSNNHFGGFTNWEAAFRLLRLTLDPVPDVILFITDGNPTTSINRGTESNGPNEDYFAHKAVKEAQQLKDAGARIIPLLLGSNIDVKNVKYPITNDGKGNLNFNPTNGFIATATSGSVPVVNTDYFNTNFDSLKNTLKVVFDNLCPPTQPPPPCVPTGAIKVILIVDTSGSIAAANAQADMRNAISSIIDTLEGTNSKLAVARFSGPRYTDIRGEASNAAWLTNGNGANGKYRDMEDNQDVSKIRGEVNSSKLPNGDFVGGTNWESALKLVADANMQADVLIFMTDGNPTASIGQFPAAYPDECDEDYYATKAVTQAKRIKAQGTRIISLLIGHEIDVNNLIKIPQPNGCSTRYSVNSLGLEDDFITTDTTKTGEPGLNQDYYVSEFSELPGYLKVISSQLCDPPKEKECEGVYFAVIVDRSGSIRDANAQPDVRKAVNSVLNTLEGTNAHLAITRFNGPSQNNDGTDGNSDLVTRTTSGYRSMNSANEVQNTRDNINQYLKNSEFEKYTNWEAAFKLVRTRLNPLPNVIVFITDGNPTVAIGYSATTSSNQEDWFAERAAREATLLKEQGVRIISVLVGDNIDVKNVRDIIKEKSGGYNFTPQNVRVSTDSSGNGTPLLNIDYYNSDFSELSNVVDSIVNVLCPPPIQPITCDTIKVAVIVDVSGSIESAQAQSTVRSAVRAIISTLDGTTALLSILRFSGPSNSGGTGNQNDAQFVTDSGNKYVPMDNSGSVSSLKSSIDTKLGNSVFGGFTNWEAAFKKTVDGLSITPDVVIFITDGNPTTSIGKGTNTDGKNEDYYTHKAIPYAQSLKDNGARIIALLLGNNIDVNNVKLPVTDNDRGINFTPDPNKFICSDSTNVGTPQQYTDYFVAQFDQLIDTLDIILRDICK